jgi:hypothetical protein
LGTGQHNIEAASLDTGAGWNRTITVASKQTQQELNIPRLSRPDYWIDPDTKLKWTANDNGAGLSWRQAERYCRELTLDGMRGWTLPLIDDLQQIFESSKEQGGYHIKGNLKLTGWQWSSTPGSQPGEGWAFDFGDGGRASVSGGDSGLNRALCVRPATPRPESRTRIRIASDQKHQRSAIQ